MIPHTITSPTAAWTIDIRQAFMLFTPNLTLPSSAAEELRLIRPNNVLQSSSVEDQFQFLVHS